MQQWRECRFGRTTSTTLGMFLLFFSGASGQPVTPSAPNLLKNGNFETPSLTAAAPYHFGKHAIADLPYYVYPRAKVRDWVYASSTGIINTASGSNPWYGDMSPTGFVGKQYDFVQGKGKLSQSFTVTSPGAYILTWLDAGRPQQSGDDGNQTYAVMLNGSTIGSYATASGQNFTPESVHLTLSANTYIISFKGTSTAGDHTSFIDNVKISGPQ